MVDSARASSEEWLVGELSETGPSRDENQDRMLGQMLASARLHIVADGMGGHKAGALAAQMTVDGLRQEIDRKPLPPAVAPLLRSAFGRANAAVYAKAHSGDPDTRGMGSTAVVLLIHGRTADIAHAGDSRAYLFRNGRLRALTKDHSRAQRMVDAGILTPEQALGHPGASVLERAVGIAPSIEVDLTRVHPLRSGDAILLCTDGLSGSVADGEIESLLAGHLPPAETARQLVDAALRNGSKDNITVQYLVQRRAVADASSRAVRWSFLAAAALALIGAAGWAIFG